MSQAVVDCVGPCDDPVVTVVPAYPPDSGIGSSCASPVHVRLCDGPVPGPFRRVVPRGVTVASGSVAAGYAPYVSGSSVVVSAGIGARVQSVTVVGLDGASVSGGDHVRVTLAGSDQVFVLAGMSFTWSVAQDAGAFAEFIADGDVVVECLGDSAARVMWTEEVP